MISDTPARVMRLQATLLAEAGMAKRFHLAVMLTNNTRELAINGIQRAHPDWTDMECSIFFCKVHYGAGLANKVRSVLDRTT